jgi:hypothetical protein
MEFEKLFIQSKGQPIYYQDREIKMIDRILLNNNFIELSAEFISTNSKWKQGIILQTKGNFEVDNQRISNKVVF